MAIRCFFNAANQGHAKAQFYLGSMYCLGQGVAVNYMEALRWYARSADQGYVDAQFDLALVSRQTTQKPFNMLPLLIRKAMTRLLISWIFWPKR